MPFVTRERGLRRLLVGSVVLLAAARLVGTANASELETRVTTSAPAAATALKGLLGVAPPAAPAAAHFFYAAGYFLRGNRSATGARATMTVHQPSLRGDYHSLAELSVSTADRKDVVELGWTVDPQLFGDTKPRVFVFHWVNGVPQGYNGNGFVVFIDRRGGIDRHEQPPGTALTVGSSVQFSIEHQAGRWWTAVNGTRMGYFPDSRWNGRLTQPDLVQTFGEVAARPPTLNNAPCARMGTGVIPTVSRGALISSVGFLPTTTAPVDLSTVATPNSTYYNVFKISGTSIRYGGPGALNCIRIILPPPTSPR